MFVCLHIMVSNTYCVVFLFCLSSSCVPYICMLPVSLDCPFLIVVSVFLCTLHLYVASFSGLSIFYCSFSFLVYPTFVCCQFLWIVHFWLSLLFSCVPYICMLPVSLDCPFLIVPSVFSNVYFIEKQILGYKFSHLKDPCNIVPSWISPWYYVFLDNIMHELIVLVTLFCMG